MLIKKRWGSDMFRIIMILIVLFADALQAKEYFFLAENRGTKWLQWYTSISTFGPGVCIANQGVFYLTQENRVVDETRYFVKIPGLSCNQTIESSPSGFRMLGCINRKLALEYSLKALKKPVLGHGELIEVFCRARQMTIMTSRAGVNIVFAPGAAKFRTFFIKRNIKSLINFKRIKRAEAEGLIEGVGATDDQLRPSIFEEEISWDE